MIEVQLITNGDFETPEGAGWTFDKPCLINTPGAPYTGERCVRLGNYSEVTSGYLSQEIEIPEYAIATLTFWLSISNYFPADDEEVNTLQLQLKQGSTLVGTLGTWTNKNATPWTQLNVDLTKYAGQTLTLVFVCGQTDSTKNSQFLIDQVSAIARLNPPGSSFPPLISDMSTDAVGYIQQYGNQIFCSCVVVKDTSDLFFYPSAGEGLTGYGANGSYYQNGIEFPTTKAPWWIEAEGGGDPAFRGAIHDFPKRGLILISEGSISILDQSDSLNMWMLFKKKEGNVYSNTMGFTNATFTPAEVRYRSGRIYILCKPNSGSFHLSPTTLVLDFVTDQIYQETGLVV